MRAQSSPSSSKPDAGFNKASSLQPPTPEAAAHSRAMEAALRREIEGAVGWIGLDRYLDLVLHAPGLGYYAAGAAKFGLWAEDGSDFVTAPELSPFFARTLARQLAEVLDGDLSRVLEFGAGSGKLAAGLVLELDRLGAPLAQYAILELSGELRARQQARLAEAFAQAGKPELIERLAWLDALPEDFRGVMLGNEVLDAMPVRLFARQSGVWVERGVGWEEGAVAGAAGRLVWRDRPVFLPAAGPLPAMLEQVPGDHDYLAEVHEAGQGFMRSLARSLARGLILQFDYGFPQHEYYHPQRTGGTLMGHYRHQSHGDPFLYPGLSDLTAHVNFTAMAEAADEAGLDVLGYTSQANFLLNAGLPALLAELDPADAARYLPQVNGAHKLVSEAEMGELFKVLALGKGLEGERPRLPLTGFARGDRTHTL
ncbi:MAG: SAM-dependent methyltransferase [Candidatus Protistobacter heckmanni]|nr:SAM-dependent methyltransferase [Candidatus Protistobacter heckmanni]